MPSNKNKPFFWLHIKKCGGESFRATFTPPYTQTSRIINPKPFIAVPKEEWNDVLNNYRIPLGEYDYKRTLFAKKFLYSAHEFDDMFKFVIVRNPYKRALSSWKYVLKGKGSLVHPKLLKMRYNFNYFIESLPEIWEEKKYRHMATHTAPIWGDVTDNEGLLLMDKIIKLENISSEIEIINKNVGCNITNYKKTNVNEKKKSSLKLSKSNISAIESVYSDDIEFLKYEL